MYLLLLTVSSVDIPKLVAMATDVASGLSYLQCVEYVHKDIAARNCMVTDDLCVKISGMHCTCQINSSSLLVVFH